MSSVKSWVWTESVCEIRAYVCEEGVDSAMVGSVVSWVVVKKYATE